MNDSVNLGLPILKTERLKLRPFHPSDFNKMRSLDTDAEVVKYLGHGKIREELETQKNFEKIFQSYTKFGMGLYLTELAETGEFVGRTGLIRWTIDSEKFWEVGYSLRKKFWNQGFATEASKFWVNWGFEHLDTSCLISLIHPENSKSKQVAMKAGMHLWKRHELDGRPIEIFRLDK